MPTYRHHLPQLTDDMFLTDGGIETTLIYDDGFDLPDFAAFPLLDDAAGHAALQRYFDAYLDIAARHRVGIVLETPTWRASPDWGARHGYTGQRLIEVNQAAVDLLVAARHRWERPDTAVVISGCIGPRGDGYHPEELMTIEEARAYHALQARAFADSEADLITAITMTHPAEAIGVALAARDVGMPVVISFTVETDGTLPSGDRLGDAINAVDDATGAYPAYYMINCAHPTHFAATLDPEAPWTARIGGIRANASAMSHAELDAATELDGGDPADLAEQYRQLRDRHPYLRVLGGCCGTNHHHIAAIAEACVTAVRS
jgi:S-methylmethionine-dependent homocysteine/selenocysteine methylase